MRRNDVVRRFGCVVVSHGVEWRLEFMLRMRNVAEDRWIEVLIFVEDDIARVDDSFVDRIP